MNGLNPESWKYSPVALLPEGIAEPKATKYFAVKDGEHTELVTLHDHAVPFESSRLEISVGENASLHHWLVFSDDEAAIRLEEIDVVVAAHGRYTLNALTVASKWSRCDFRVHLAGEGAACELLGLDLAKGKSHVDRHLLVEHEVGRTTSKQLFKGVFDDESSASFYGKVKVNYGADGSSAKQTNRNLLLSGQATVNTRPQLEIDTDEVACTHGATVGQLDADAVFFLRSRGLSEVDARALLTEAFAREVLNGFKAGSHKDDLERRVLSWLKKEQR
jgi:Fe-S cluster assembly protein SufD